MFTIRESVLPVYDNGQDIRYKRLYLRSEFNFLTYQTLAIMAILPTNKMKDFACIPI